MKPRLLLIDDPEENDLTDLVRLLSGRGPCKLTVIAEVVAETEREPEAVDAEIAQASAVTAGAPVPHAYYRLAPVSGRNGGPPVAVADAVPALFRIEPGFRVVVAFVTTGTLPLLEALHVEPRTRPFLKIGVTGPRLDTNYNLAQKLFWDEKIHYHEHSFAIDRVLNRRLAAMMRSHSERGETSGRRTETG